MTKRSEDISPEIGRVLAARGLSEDEQLAILSTTLLSVGRLRGMVDAIDMVKGVDGDTAEIGVANGGTSRLIARLNGQRRHWVCDTFEGLVDVGAEDPQFTNGQFHNPAHKVEAVLAGVLNVRFAAGYFPASAPLEMQQASYSLVHIDVDTYTSVKACFAFFASRMSPGGVVVLDDVLERGTVGAIKAFAELESKNTGRWQVMRRDCPPQAVLRFS